MDHTGGRGAAGRGAEVRGGREGQIGTSSNVKVKRRHVHPPTPRGGISKPPFTSVSSPPIHHSHPTTDLLAVLLRR